VFLILMDENMWPIFLIEIKDNSHLAVPSKCAAADRQMCSHYKDLLYDCPLPILYGLSTIGTKMCVDTSNTTAMCLHPPRVQRGTLTGDNSYNYLVDGWNVGILSAEEFAKMKEIVNFINSQ
ncbi:hypothetical protein B0H10DRAFT_1665257, partial [Mycena sp. CBHHK59/15]